MKMKILYLFLILSTFTNSIKGQGHHSLSVVPRINFGYFFPLQTKVLNGEDFLKSKNAFPILIAERFNEDGKSSNQILCHGGYGLDIFYNKKRSYDELNWSFGIGVFMQNQHYIMDIPDFNYEGNLFALLSLYYRSLEYKLAVRKSFEIKGLLFHAQLNGIFTNWFQYKDDKWKNVADDTEESITIENGVGYSSSGNQNIIPYNILIQPEIGVRYKFIEISLSYSFPVFKNTSTHNLTYYRDSLPVGTTQIAVSQMALWLNVKIPLEFLKWQKKNKVKYSEPVVEKIETFIPPSFEGRPTKLDETVIVTASPRLKIRIWDNQKEDGDIVTIYFNDKKVLDHYLLTKAYREFSLELTKTENYLVYYAENEGSERPNTAAFDIIDEETQSSILENPIILKATTKQSTALKIIHK